MRWEYKTLYMPDTELDERRVEATIAPLGEHGWELVGVAERERHGYTHEVVLFFRRPAAAA